MKKYKIIIVENDEDEQFFLKEGFDATGLFDIIVQLRNGDELFEWMEQNLARLPDFILSDLNMPGKNGYDIISGITSTPSYQHIPVIIMSTSSAKIMIDKCIGLGAADYLVKPDTFIAYKPFVENLHSQIIQKQILK